MKIKKINNEILVDNNIPRIKKFITYHKMKYNISKNLINMEHQHNYNNLSNTMLRLNRCRIPMNLMHIYKYVVHLRCEFITNDKLTNELRNNLNFTFHFKNKSIL